jgi:RNA polymerase sigma factor (sigma-70 family)
MLINSLETDFPHRVKVLKRNHKRNPRGTAEKAIRDKHEVVRVSRTDFARHIQVVADVEAGLESGLLDLYSHVDAFRYFFFRATHSSDEGEDLIHETYLIVLEQIRSGHLRRPECLMAFILSVGKRRCSQWIANQIKRRKRLISEQDLAFFDLTDNSPRADEQYLDNERRAAVHSVIEGLSELNRKITQMAIDDVPPEEIRQILGLTETQFRLRKSRARAIIRSKYNKLIGKVTVLEPPDLRLGAQAYAEFMGKMAKPMLVAYSDLPIRHRHAWQKLANESPAFEEYGCYFPTFQVGRTEPDQVSQVFPFKPVAAAAHAKP